MDFKIGDVVQLKSGGPRMAVSAIGENGSAHCEWFDKAKLLSANFAIEILEPAGDGDSQTLVRGQATGIDVSALMDVVQIMRSRELGGGPLQDSSGPDTTGARPTAA